MSHLLRKLACHLHRSFSDPFTSQLEDQNQANILAVSDLMTITNLVEFMVNIYTHGGLGENRSCTDIGLFSTRSQNKSLFAQSHLYIFVDIAYMFT